MIKDAEANSQIEAPWDRDLLKADSGWVVKTEIRPSRIPESGNGRFALQFIKEGTIMREPNKIVSPSEGRKPGTMLVAKNLEELAMIAAGSKGDTGVAQLTNFGASPYHEEEDN